MPNFDRAATAPTKRRASFDSSAKSFRVLAHSAVITTAGASSASDARKGAAHARSHNTLVVEGKRTAPKARPLSRVVVGCFGEGRGGGARRGCGGCRVAEKRVSSSLLSWK